jgi:hypothetical protein
LYDPVAKRGKGKKFAYKYKGPYELAARISPLIYRVKVGGGKVVVVHVNRLKKVRNRKGEPVPAQRRSSEKEKLVKFSEPQEKGTPTGRVVSTVSDSASLITRNREEAIPEDVEDEVVESSSVRENSSVPDWAPDTQHVRKRLH